MKASDDMSQDSLFQRLGGADAIEAAVDIFYKRVMADPSLSPFFKETNLKKQIAKQRLFMTYAFGGASHYSGQSMENAHAKARSQGLNEDHFNKVANHLINTLNELNVPPSMVDEVIAIVAPTKEAIIGKQ